MTGPDAITRAMLPASAPFGEAEPGPLAVDVLVASHDPATIAAAAPRVAARLYPGRRFGAVLHVEPWPTPPRPKGAPHWPADWSAVTVEDITRRYHR